MKQTKPVSYVKCACGRTTLYDSSGNPVSSFFSREKRTVAPRLDLRKLDMAVPGITPDCPGCRGEI